MRTPDVDAGPWFWDPDRNPSEMTWDDNVVVVPHHTNCGQVFSYGDHRKLLPESGVYWGKYDWSVPNDRVRLVEIVQGRGSFEADQPDEYWGIELGKQRASLRDALRIGFRISFVAGTDNNEGYPGQIRGYYSDLTCFRAAELTREAVWQAMDQRRTYATWGAPIVADFSVSGLPSGSEGLYEVKVYTTVAASPFPPPSTALHRSRESRSSRTGAPSGTPSPWNGMLKSPTSRCRNRPVPGHTITCA